MDMPISEKHARPNHPNPPAKSPRCRAAVQTLRKQLLRNEPSPHAVIKRHEQQLTILYYFIVQLAKVDTFSKISFFYKRAAPLPRSPLPVPCHQMHTADVNTDDKPGAERCGVCP